MGFGTPSAGVWLLVGIAAMSVGYVAGCFLAVVVRHLRVRSPVPLSTPAVSILTPLCGEEPGLEQNLRTLCQSATADVQIVWGVRDAEDAALPIARRVLADFPRVDAEVIVGCAPLGLNAKVNTLARLAAAARHDVVVIADSDTRFAPGDLARLVDTLRDPTVGIASCLFRSRPSTSRWSRFAGLNVDEWYLPSVLLSRALGSEAYCSGPVMALRRDVLERIGGIAPLATFLADDYELGARVRRLGLHSVIADCEVAVTVEEPSGARLLSHELRWMRTIRAITPVGHACLALTYAVPLTTLTVLATGASAGSLIMLGLAVATRAALHAVVSRAPGHADPRHASWWLVPLRDFWSAAVWVLSYTGRTVTWRGRKLWVGWDGVLYADGQRPPRLGILGRRIREIRSLRGST